MHAYCADKKKCTSLLSNGKKGEFAGDISTMVGVQIPPSTHWTTLLFAISPVKKQLYVESIECTV